MHRPISETYRVEPCRRVIPAACRSSSGGRHPSTSRRPLPGWGLRWENRMRAVSTASSLAFDESSSWSCRDGGDRGTWLISGYLMEAKVRGNKTKSRNCFRESVVIVLPLPRSCSLSALLSTMQRLKNTLACEACRRRKSRCSGSAPCASCQKNSIRCEFRTNRLRRGPRPKAPAALQKPKEPSQSVAEPVGLPSPVVPDVEMARLEEPADIMEFAMWSSCREDLRAVINTKEIVARLNKCAFLSLDSIEW